MKNKVIILISCALIFLTIILVNIVIFNMVWYAEYAEYNYLKKEDINVMSKFDRETFLAEYTNFNSAEFSMDALYQNITEKMKTEYPTIEKFEEYCNNKILNKFDGQQYYSLIQYISEEKVNGMLKIKYSLYMFDLETYIEVLNDDEFDFSKSKFSIDVFVVEDKVDNYKIEF